MQYVQAKNNLIETIKNSDVSESIRNWSIEYIDQHFNRIKWDAEFLLNINPNGQILNIGGSPYLLEALTRDHPSIKSTTLDLSPGRFSTVIDQLSIDVLKYDVEHDDMSKLLEERGKFQVVVFCELFEHLRFNLLNTMRSVAELLEKDGILYLTTPNGRSLFSLVRNMLQKRTGPSVVGEWRKLQDIGHMGHVREYSATEVKEVLEFCGFRVESVTYRNIYKMRFPKNVIEQTACTLNKSFSRDMAIVAKKK